MTLSTKIEVFLRILHLFAVGLHTCTAVARSLCVSWAFLFDDCWRRWARTKKEVINILVAF